MRPQRRYRDSGGGLLVHDAHLGVTELHRPHRRAVYVVDSNGNRWERQCPTSGIDARDKWLELDDGWSDA